MLVVNKQVFPHWGVLAASLGVRTLNTSGQLFLCGLCDYRKYCSSLRLFPHLRNGSVEPESPWLLPALLLPEGPGGLWVIWLTWLGSLCSAEGSAATPMQAPLLEGSTDRTQWPSACSAARL